MNAIITLTKEQVEQEQVTAITAKAKQMGWTVSWTISGVEA